MIRPAGSNINTLMIPFLITANGASVEHNNIYAHGPKKETAGDIAKRSYTLQRLKMSYLGPVQSGGKYTLELNANSMGPLQIVAPVTLSREGFAEQRTRSDAR